MCYAEKCFWRVSTIVDGYCPTEFLESKRSSYGKESTILTWFAREVLFKDNYIMAKELS
jgi:hypothetical protein